MTPRKAGSKSLSLPERKSVQGSEEGGGVSGRHNGGEERGKSGAATRIRPLRVATSKSESAREQAVYQPAKASVYRPLMWVRQSHRPPIGRTTPRPRRARSRSLSSGSVTIPRPGRGDRPVAGADCGASWLSGKCGLG